MRDFELHKKDKEILEVMQRLNLCVPQITKIAHRTHLPTSTVRDRILAMEKRGVIEGYAPIVDRRAAGQPVLVFIMANIEDLEHPEVVCKKIAKHEWVQGVYFLVGDKDVLIKVHASGIDEYNAKMKKIRRYIVGGGGIVVSKVFKDSLQVEV